MTDTTPTTFLRLLAAGDKAAALADAVAAIRAGSPAAFTYAVDPASFRQIPGSPFAYWVSERVRHIFIVWPRLEGNVGEVRSGSHTSEDFRRLRLWHEVPPQTIGYRIRWALINKGGAYSPYYSDVHLLADWDESRRTYRDFYGRPGREIERPEALEYYFRPGLTYPRRTTSGLSVRVMPAGCIFADKGPAIFVARDTAESLLSLLALVNSTPFSALLSLQLGAADVAARSYEVGLVQRTPVPDLAPDDERALAALAREAHDLKRDRDRDDEVTHPFTVPALVRLLHAQPTIAAALDALAAEEQALQQRLTEIQAEIDDRCFALYGFSPEDRAQAEGQETENAEDAEIRGERGEADEFTTEETEGTEDRVEAEAGGDETAEGTDHDNGTLSLARAGGLRGGTPLGAGSPAGPSAAARTQVANLLMYALGCAFGRWDARIGRDPSLAPALADPFAPLPVCAPGALVGPDGLPATRERIASEAWLRARPDAITLPPEGAFVIPAIAADALSLLSSPDPSLPSVSSVPSVVNPSASSASSAVDLSPLYPLPVAWEGLLADDPDAPNDIVRRVRAVFDALFGARADAVEAEAVAILGLRDLREYFRNPRLMWDYHIGRYSKSRRKAPIYWLLQSPRRGYAIWLYYHRLDRDLIFKALTLHLLPKIAREEQRLAEMAARRSQAEGAEARRLGKEVEKQEALLADLREFHAALDRAAKHYLVPDLNDGVLLTIAPLWEVVPWKEAKTAWQQLLAGKYAWSSIGQRMREKGLVQAK